jgi:glycosyltransferase involved in cell wall biosynthesis
MWPIVRNSDGFYEQSGCAVIYFPTPQFIRCDIPSVYTIHDLQHVYYPEFFSNDDLSWKEATFRAGCEHADTIVAISNRVKEDIVTSYGTDPNRIEVIYWGPPTQAHAAPENSTSEALLKEYSVRSPYVLFPSMTRIHKNHIRLLEATAKVRDESGLVMQLVCTGHQTDFWPKIKEKLVSLRLEHQVKFLGMVHSVDLRAFYRLAEFVIFPSLFEGAGMPVLEAWQDNAPVACSDVTSLPELAGDAAFLFDPTSVSSIADALVRMHTDTALREGLRRRGSERLQHFSWMKTAKHYRAVFRRAARNPLNEEDRWLLSHPPLGVSSCS